MTGARGILFISTLTASLAGCASTGVLEPPLTAWPPLHESMPQMVEVAVSEPAALPPIVPDDEASPSDHYETRAPGIHVRRGEAEGFPFLEVVLGEVDPESALPLIVVIHGRGDRPRVPGGPFSGLARPARIILPRAPMSLGDGFSWLPVRAADGQTEVLSTALRETAARLARFVAGVRDMRATLGPTVVTGFSQGGMLAITLAVLHPDVVGVAFPLAGWLPPPLWPSGAAPPNAPPIRAMHARDDERIAYGPTLESYDHLRSSGWDLELTFFDGVGHAMSAAMDAIFHGWLDQALDRAIADELALRTETPAVEQPPRSRLRRARVRSPREPRRARRPARPRQERARRHPRP